MSALLYVIVLIIIVALIVGLYQKSTNALCNSKKRLDGKTTIVTGGTSGMGLEIAIDFADRGARVIIACPFKDQGEDALQTIQNKTGNKDVVFKLLDLASLTSVKTFAADILDSEKRLDILINNAGVGNVSSSMTKDGMSFIMQVNYFGQFLLTLLLLPLLIKTGTNSEPSRIVNTSSVLHNFGTINFDKLNDNDHYYSLQFYANSKLCLMLFAHEMTKRIKEHNVVVNCVDPGAVGTRIFDSTGSFFGLILSGAAFYLFKTPWQGAQTAIHVALDRKAGMVSGQMFKNCKLSRAKRAGYDDDTASKLWQESLRLVKLSNQEIDKCLH